MINVYLRFYEELNDFLPKEKQKIQFQFSVSPNTSIKDIIESLGVPHTEIDLILVNQQSVDFNYRAKDGDQISVYPMFEALNISELVRLRPEPLRNTQFILDVHLGKLAKYLRLLGFDTLYDKTLDDDAIAKYSYAEKRIVLTRDVGLLKNKLISHGYWIRNTNPIKQTHEVLEKFDLYNQCKPFTRCIECNHLLFPISKNEIVEKIPPMTEKYFDNFMLCSGCNRIYWEGTHYEKLKELVNQFIKNEKS